MVHFIYKTTNIINGNYYIGKHSTKNNNDSYLGSGDLLKKAIKKYGKENFKREILFECNSDQELFEKEQEIVTIDIVSDPNSYNIALGGYGAMCGRKHTDGAKEKMSLKAIGRTFTEETRNKKRISMTGKVHTEETKKKISLSKIGKKRIPFTEEAKLNMSLTKIGKNHTEETKNKISLTKTGKRRVYLDDGSYKYSI